MNTALHSFLHRRTMEMGKLPHYYANEGNGGHIGNTAICLAGLVLGSGHVSTWF